MHNTSKWPSAVPLISFLFLVLRPVFLLLALLQPALPQAAKMPNAPTLRPGEAYTFVLKTSPIDLVIPHNTIRWLSGKAEVAPRLGWQFDLGYMFRDGSVFDLSQAFPALAFQRTDRRRFNFNVETELRRYLGRDKALNGFYGAE